MRLGELGEQIVIRSPIAFSRLQYIDSEPAFSSKYYLKRQEHDRAARAAYRRLKASDGLQDIYMIDIMREGMNRDDPRLR